MTISLGRKTVTFALNLLVLYLEEDTGEKSKQSELVFSLSSQDVVLLLEVSQKCQNKQLPFQHFNLQFKAMGKKNTLYKGQT